MIKDIAQEGSKFKKMSEGVKSRVEEKHHYSIQLHNNRSIPIYVHNNRKLDAFVMNGRKNLVLLFIFFLEGRKSVLLEIGLICPSRDGVVLSHLDSSA